MSQDHALAPLEVCFELSKRSRAAVDHRLAEPGVDVKPGVEKCQSSANVFRDLGFPAEQAEHLLIRSDLPIRLQQTITSRRIKQVETARLLRVSQPRISDLLRGRIDLFSTDTLIDMLARLGVRGRLVVEGPRRSKIA